MKRSIEGFNGINFVVDEEESKGKLKKKNLLNELLELQKDCVSKKRKLQAAKLRRDNILGEILFLKQRRRYLLKNQSSNVDSERNISHLKKHLDAESEVPKEARSNSGYDAAVETTRPAFTSNLNPEHEVGYEELLAGGDVLRMECVPKNYLIDDNNRVGKKKLSWHGQVTLKYDDSGLCFQAMLLGLSKIVVVPMSNPPKIHYFWRIRHAPVDVNEESEQHSFQVLTM